MFDTTREIIYRGFTVNVADGDMPITGGNATGSGIGPGCKVDSVDMSDVDVVQWTEKRSQADGNDAGDVMLGVRRIRMTGSLYDLSRGALFDSLDTLRAALNPVLAQREEPLDKGYRPLYFSKPTERLDDYPTAQIDLQVKAMPRAFQQMTKDDEIGGDDEDALTVPWQATFICREPDILSADPVTVNFSATSTVSGTTGSNATDLFTKATHGLVANDRITFLSKTGGSGLSLSVAYYVLSSGLTSGAFKLSLTSGGAVVDLGSDVSASVWVKSVTATNSVTGVTGVASTNILTKTAHGLVAGDRIQFSSLTGGTGLATATTYYISATGLTADAFELSSTSGGAVIDFTTDISAATFTTYGWNNRGTYLGKWNALLVVGAGAGTIVATVGDSVLTVTVPASTVNRIIRIKDDKTVTFEENSVETPQMGSIAFTGDTTYPLIDPGLTPYTVTFHGMGGVVSGSRMWFYEQYA